MFWKREPRRCPGVCIVCLCVCVCVCVFSLSLSLSHTHTLSLSVCLCVRACVRACMRVRVRVRVYVACARALVCVREYPQKKRTSKHSGKKAFPCSAVHSELYTFNCSPIRRSPSSTYQAYVHICICLCMYVCVCVCVY
jgi:hypothetical protein